MHSLVCGGCVLLVVVVPLLTALVDSAARLPRAYGPPLVHNLTLGKPGKYDKLLYLERVKRPARRGGVLETVHFPPSWQPHDFLTAIHVEDQWRNGSNGYPYLAGGGLYQREATVRLETGPRFGLDFIVKFYGH